jgi:hypothetical protein
MPVSIPAGTKFEAIKPTTNVNRRSALVNANDLTYTIEDIAAAAGGTFPITNNYIPKANSAGSIVDSSLYETIYPSGVNLAGNYNEGIYFTYQSSTNLLQVYGDLAGASYAYIGDIFGNSGPSWGISLDGSVAFPFVSILTAGVSRLTLDASSGTYDFGGSTTRLGIINADVPQCSLSVSSDLVVDISGTKYIKVDVNGTLYNIELVP